MERALEREADKRGLTGKARDRLVYGTMVNRGWRPKRTVDKIAKREVKLRAAIPTMKTRTDRLIQLNAKTDKLLEFRRLPDGEEVDDFGRPIATVAAGAAAGVGGVLGHRAIQSAGGYKTVANNAVIRGSTGILAAGKSLERTEAAGGLSAMQKIARALKSGVKAARYAMATREEKLILLNERLDKVIVFTAIQKPENNLRRGAGFGFLGGSGIGLVAGAQDATKFKRAGVVYRKRDAFGNAFGGAVAGAIAKSATSPLLARTRLSEAAKITSGLATLAGVSYGSQRLLANRTLAKRKAILVG